MNPWRTIVYFLSGILILFLCFSNKRQLKRHSQNAMRSLYYSLDPAVSLGRDNVRHPAPVCPPMPKNPRVAVVTYLRDSNYLTLFRQLECTLRKSNPHVELAVMHVPGELERSALEEIHSLNVTLIDIEPLHYENYFERRYARNWVKLRAWGLTQYDSILLVDSDVVVIHDLSSLFTQICQFSSFAAVPDQSRWLGMYKTKLKAGFNGGVSLLRPCKATERHMISILQLNPKLRFAYGIAEQDFLSWYFKYTSLTLPLEYNVQASQSLHGNVTVGGQAPVIVHFTENTKPFGGPMGLPGHQFLCSLEEMNKGI